MVNDDTKKFVTRLCNDKGEMALKYIVDNIYMHIMRYNYHSRNLEIAIADGNDEWINNTRQGRDNESKLIKEWKLVLRAYVELTVPDND